MKVGIIGAGNIGGTLARRLVQLGHQVSIANSRGAQSLTAPAAEMRATAVSVHDATQTADVVILAIPTKAVTDLPKDLFANVANDVVVIDAGNYHPELRDGRIPAIDEGMLDSQWVAKQIGRPVIKAFNNILADSLRDKGIAKGKAGRIALSVAGDSPEAKAIVSKLIDELGFDPIDAGNLADSWRQQTGAPAYCHDFEAVALKRALATADHNQISNYRAEREASIKKSMADSAPQ